jgi:A118 family predicted phage portal protein
VKNVLEGIKSYVRKVVSGLLGTENRIKMTNVITSDMSNTIKKWFDMYEDKGYWLINNSDTLSLPSAISSELARLVTLEFEYTVSDDNGAPVDVNSGIVSRASFIQKCINDITAEIWKHVEYCCAGGGIVFKPYVNGDSISPSVVQADCFFPTGYDSSGDVNSGEFYEVVAEDNMYYVRREIHTLVKESSKSSYIIENKAYKSYNGDDLGSEIPLNSIERWADIAPIVQIDNIDSPLFAYMKIPLGNKTDRTCPVGVSVFANSEHLIRNADEQYQRLLWEFESGERAIDASVDAFKKDKKSKSYVLPSGKERLFRLNQFDAQSGAGHGLFEVFSPEFRDAAIKSGLNTILQRIEFNCGLAYGTISDPLIVDKTAEEIKTSKQRSYSTVKLIQSQLEKAMNVYAKACDSLATLYSLAPAGKYTAKTLLDDSIVVDAETERMRDMQEVTQGILNKWEYRMKWYGETETRAKEMTQEDMTDEEILFGSDSSAGDTSKSEEENA